MRKLVRRTDLMRLKTLKLLHKVMQELSQEEELYIIEYDKKIFLTFDIFKTNERPYKTNERPYSNIDIESPEESEKFSSIYPFLQPFQEVPVIVFYKEYDECKENIIHINYLPENTPLYWEIVLISALYNCEYIEPRFEPAVFIESLFYKIVETNEEEAKEEL